MDKIQKLSASTAIILETRVPRKDNTFPVKLRVTYDREQKYYSLRYKVKNSEGTQTEHQKFWLNRFDNTISLNKEEFAKVRNPGSREPFKTLFLYLNELEELARGVIGSIPAFSFQKFKDTYFEKPASKQDVLYFLTTCSIKIAKEGRISTSKSYTNSVKSLKSFTKSEVLPFSKITVSFLKEYEKWMLTKRKKGKSKTPRSNSLTTVGIYLRNVRTVFHQAIKEGYLKAESYPFGEGKFEIPTGRNIKKSLQFEEIKKIAHYKVQDDSVACRHRDYWLFSYLCNGINVKDIARLKYRNIEGEIIKITRAKTEREKRHDPRPITIVITNPIRKIIDTWGNKPVLPDQYIFPILSKGMTPLQEYKNIQQATKQINKYINRIAAELELSSKVTSYTARHSFATVLKRSGASMEFISESLGHSSMATTENYLSDFEIDEKRKWAEKAADF
jgi:site-specific recombinase XerD